MERRRREEDKEEKERKTKKRKKRKMTYYDLMYEVFFTGNLARIEGYLHTLDPNMDDYTREDLFNDMKEVHPDFEVWEDVYGFGKHLDDGGTLIELAARGQHQSSENIIELLVKHGARVDPRFQDR